MSEIAPARVAAYEVVRRTFEGGAWADRVLRSAAERHGLDRRDRALAQRLAYGTVQRRDTLDHFGSRLADRPAADLDPPVLAAVRLGLYEILFAAGTPDHAAVDQAVELTKQGGAGRGAGLVNAVLRRAARERDELLGSLSDADPAAAALAHSHPLWLVEMWWAELGAEVTRELLRADNEPAETALRVNALRGDPEAVLASITTEGAVHRPESPPAAPESVVVDGPITAEIAARIDAGELVPQSRASAMVVDLLAPRPGERVLDLCAGPGIKTTLISARMRAEGEVVAVELDPGRASELRELCERLGAGNVRVAEGDAARVDVGAGYDRVLVDPPCSDLGTLASRPDARWRKSARGIERVADLQSAILARGAAALRPGGTLVYSTCTISRRENEDIVAGLLADPPAPFSLDDLGAEQPALASPRQPRALQTRPDRDRTDGFFAARLRRGE